MTVLEQKGRAVFLRRDGEVHALPDHLQFPQAQLDAPWGARIGPYPTRHLDGGFLG